MASKRKYTPWSMVGDSMAFAKFRRNEMWKSGGIIATIAFSIAFSLPAFAADCSANIDACISGNQGKANAVAKCQAAGRSCAKTGVYNLIR
jgi:hypothetical protein